jgi:hypothetical protein
MRTLLTLLLSAAPLVAAPVPKGLKKQADGSDIVGLWAKTPGGTSGWYFNPDGSAGCGTPGVPGGCVAVYKVDATQTPKHLDWSQDGGKTWHLAVYEIEGDVLRINFGGGNTGQRPTAIGPNTGFQFETGTRNPDRK